MKPVVVVESPAKAKTISRYLQNRYTVLASFGHVRYVPSAKDCVLPDKDFQFTWKILDKNKRYLETIIENIKQSGHLILATDPDREGEAISWHILEILKAKRLLPKKIERVSFQEITQNAIAQAFDQPRALDERLVNAYLARRALDYLVGFEISPLLWRKLKQGRSAGRVQSVALRLLVEREIAIRQFTPQEYWDIDGNFDLAGVGLTARLVAVDGKNLTKLSLGDEKTVKSLVAKLRDQSYQVISVETKKRHRKPYAPFTTSTLQQEAARKLHYSVSRTMKLAQSLYEGVEIAGQMRGLISYIRTDSVNMASSAITSQRQVICQRYGQAYLPKSPPQYRKRNRTAQEAHEAIRPTDFSLEPSALSGQIDTSLWRLYDLIWRRAVASGMTEAVHEHRSIVISDAGGDRWRAHFSRLVFDGFLRVYEETSEEPTEPSLPSDFPALTEGSAAKLNSVQPHQHFTEAPGRFSEAGLVKQMEELGIGRPSTYAVILSLLQERNYATLDKRRFQPTEAGVVVSTFMSAFFPTYVAYDFTADLEEKLDAISRGESAWLQVMEQFWQSFKPQVEQVLQLANGEIIDGLQSGLRSYFPQTESAGSACPRCQEGRLQLKPGRHSTFLSCDRFPSCDYSQSTTGEQHQLPYLLGEDDGEEILVCQGPYGLYLQRGREKKSAKQAPFPSDATLSAITLEQALRYLSLPRTIGTHPDTGATITAHIGQYGPYLRCGSQSATLTHEQDVFEIGINHAVSLLTVPSLGYYQDEAIMIKKGRFGPYLSCGQTNVSLGRKYDPETITEQEAQALIEKKRASGSSRKPQTTAIKKKSTRSSARKKR